MHKQRVVFVHGLGSFGAAAWPKQHGLALRYDCLFLRRHGFDPVAEPLESDISADVAILVDALADSGGGHVVAHEQGAISAMLAAVERPDLVFSLSLVEPACLSLTAELPATASHRALMQPLFDVRSQLGDADYEREYFRRAYAAEAGGLQTPEARRSARRLRLQAPPWKRPAHCARCSHAGADRWLGAVVRGNCRVFEGYRCPPPRSCRRAPSPGLRRRRPVHPVLHCRRRTGFVGQGVVSRWSPRAGSWSSGR